MNAVINLNDAQIEATDLRSSGILVTCLMHGATLTVTDKAAGAEVADNKRASRQAVEFRKKLASGMTELKTLQNMRQAMHNGLRVLTYEFAGDARYLPSARFEQFVKWWTQLLEQHAEAKQAFLDAWPAAVASAAFELGDLFDRNDYPTVDELERKFYVELVQSEVPVGDFRNVLFAEALGDAKASLQRHVDRTMQAMLDAQMEQMKSVLESLSNACTVEYEDTDDGMKVKRKRLHQTTLEKAMEMVETFKTFNPAGSSELESIRRMVADALDGMPYEVLRTSDTCREQVKEDVDAILSKFNW